MSNIPAYYSAELNTASKIIKVQAPDVKVTYLYALVAGAAAK